MAIIINKPNENLTCRRILIPILFCCLCLSFSPHATAEEMVNAPHNAASGVRCSDCHSYSIWWQYSPTSKQNADFGDRTDAVCQVCHDINSSLGKGCGHSNLTMEETADPNFGTWKTNCLDCHSPHAQAQLKWRQSVPNDLYLVTGTIGSSSTFTYNGIQTVFDYTSPTYDAEWIDPSTWQDKNDDASDRGLILVVNTSIAEKTFKVINADSQTITVLGNLGAANAGKNFGLIYGRFIRAMIDYNGVERDVKFFNPYKVENGYIDYLAPPAGICQVCHLQTSLWLSSGSGVDHYPQEKCTYCHHSDQGFKPDHIINTHNVTHEGNCDSCHDLLNGMLAIDTLHDPNGTGSCEICHSSTRPEVITAITTGSAECSACHSNTIEHSIIYYDSNQVDLPINAINGNGALIWQADYLPFGENE